MVMRLASHALYTLIGNTYLACMIVAHNIKQVLKLMP